MKKIRIATGAGYAGDRIEPAGAGLLDILKKEKTEGFSERLQ